MSPVNIGGKKAARSDEPKLNEFQQAVVDDLASGPTVVEACPGSGKTATTEQMVPALLASGVDPLRLLLVTFTNAASGESRRRVSQVLFPDVTVEELAFLEQPRSTEAAEALKKAKGWDDDNALNSWVKEDPRREMVVEHFSTIHALSLRTLKELGYEDFQVLASGSNGKRDNRLWWDYQALLKDGIKELDWEQSHKKVEWWFGHAVNNLVEPHEAERWFADRLEERGGPVWDAPKLAEMYRRYRDFCKRHKALDFNMMQAFLVKLIRESQRVRERVANLFDIVIVDEAQDTSPTQCEILWTMASRTGRVVFVGDVDQSLFAFRNAQPEVMRSQFEARWPNPKRFNLPVNYRSTRAIIGTAEGLIQDNYGGDLDRYLKPFEARPDAPEGEPLTYTETADVDELAQEVANAAQDAPGDWFLLSRTRAECAAVHTKLIELGVPAVNKSGGLLFGAPHVRKVLAYARMACDYHGARDDLEILSEIANVASVEYRAPMSRRRHVEGCPKPPPWKNCGCPLVYEEGVDQSPVRFYGRKGVEQAGSWAGVIRQQDQTNRGGYPTTNAKATMDLVRFVSKLERLADDSRACLNAIIEGSVLNWLKHDQGLDDQDLAENGKTEDFDLLINMTEPDETLEQYLDRVEQLSRGGVGGDESESILVGTIHWSKGQQRPKVAVNTTRLPVIPPERRAGELPTTPPPTMPEERRLLYVAITRAQDECHLFGALEWNNQGMERSEFVQAMIDRGLVEFEEPEPDGTLTDEEYAEMEGLALPIGEGNDYDPAQDEWMEDLPDSNAGPYSESLRPDEIAWLKHKTEFARRETEQERAAFASDPDYRGSCKNSEKEYNDSVLQDANQNNSEEGNYAQGGSRLAGPEPQALGVSTFEDGDMRKYKNIYHYRGDGVVEVELTKGQTSLVIDWDWAELKAYNWWTLERPNTCYAAAKIDGKIVLMHRLILDAKEGQVVDHINHDGLDNRRSNIRLCTQSQNIANSRPHKTHFSSQYKGVSWKQDRGKWKAEIGVDGKNIYLGYFDDEQEAARAYNVAAIQHFGEYAHLNDLNADILSQFPSKGMFENSIYRPSARELAAALPEWTPTVNEGQLVLMKELAPGHTALCYTSIMIGQIAGGTGQDSIRVTRRDEGRDGRMFYYKNPQSWVTRQVPVDVTTNEAAAAHLAAKVEAQVDQMTRPCPECGALQMKCKAGKGRDSRTWWKAMCEHRVKEGGW